MTDKKEEANPVGRPPTYDPIRTVERAEAYIEAPRSDKANVRIPTVEGLALFLGVSRKTVYQWRDAHPEFGDIIERLMTAQGQTLIENGLDGTYNSTITKLMLTKHDYSEKQEIDHTSKGERLGSLKELDETTLTHLARRGDGGTSEKGTS